ASLPRPTASASPSSRAPAASRSRSRSRTARQPPSGSDRTRDPVRRRASRALARSSDFLLNQVAKNHVGQRLENALGVGLRQAIDEDLGRRSPSRVSNQEGSGERIDVLTHRASLLPVGDQVTNPFGDDMIHPRETGSDLGIALAKGEEKERETSVLAQRAVARGEVAADRTAQIGAARAHVVEVRASAGELPVAPFVDQREQQRALVWEVVVKGADADTRPLGDVGHAGRVVAPLREEQLRGPQHTLACDDTTRLRTPSSKRGGFATACLEHPSKIRTRKAEYNVY